MTDFTDVGVSHELKLQSTNIPTLSNADIVKKIWWFEDGMWDPDGLDRGGVYAMFRAGTDEEPGVYLNLFEIISSSTGAALLATDEGLVVQKDISAGGFVCSNQGELWLGSGRNDQVDVPKIVLGNSGVSRLEGGGPLDVPEVPSGGQLPAGEDGQLFIYAPTSSLYKHNGITWVYQGPTSNYAGYFDTLYIRKANAQDPAHLDVGDINIHGHLGVGDTVTSDLNPNPDLDLGNYNNPWASVVTSSLWVKSPNTQFGVTAGDEWNGSGYDAYLHPQNPTNGGLGLGTANYPFKWVDATYVYTNYLNSLSTPLHLESAFEQIFMNDSASANTGLELGNSSTSGGVVYIDFHYGRNTTEDYNVRLINDSDCILTFQTRTTTGGILPAAGGWYVLGTSTRDWSYVYANFLRYDVNCEQYDALDDLALVKNYKTKTIIKNDAETSVIDMVESFPFLIEENHIAHEKLQGYLLGCLKALVLKVESLESEIAELKTLT